MKQTINTLIRILVILLLYFITQVIIMTVFAAIGGAGVEGDIQGAMESFLAEKASLISLVHNALIIACLLWYRKKNSAMKEAMPFDKLPMKELICCIGLGFCAAITVTTLLSILPIPEEAMGAYTTSIAEGTKGAPLERFLSLVLFAPIAEELMFRGAIYGSFRRTSKPVVAVVVSCAIFGLMHQDPIWMIYAFLMGLGLTLALNCYGTLIAPIVLHMAFNFTGSYVTTLITAVPIAVPILACAGCVYFIRRCSRLKKAQPGGNE